MMELLCLRMYERYDYASDKALRFFFIQYKALCWWTLKVRAMKMFVLVNHRVNAYVHIERSKKNKVRSSSSLIKTLIQLGKKLYIHLNIHVCVSYTQVTSNRRVTCTYVSLNKHSTVAKNYHVNVTILYCIMNELRQIDYRNQRFCSLWRLEIKRTQCKSSANKLDLNVSFDGVRLLIYRRWRIYNRIIMLKLN